jgi:hypothetical protein
MTAPPLDNHAKDRETASGLYVAIACEDFDSTKAVDAISAELAQARAEQREIDAKVADQWAQRAGEELDYARRTEHYSAISEYRHKQFVLQELAAAIRAGGTP